MPLVSRLGAASSRGFGEFTSSSTPTYVEDVFSSAVFIGNGSTQTVYTGVGIGSQEVQSVGQFGSNTALSYADNAALRVDSFEDFTVECWVYQTNFSSNQTIVAKTNTSNGDPNNFIILSSNVGQWNVWMNGNVLIYGSNSPATNQWFHVAVSRSGSTVRLFVNGTNVGSGSEFRAISIASPLKLGAMETSGFQYPLIGQLSNFRFVKGTALYTSNFTPPTAPLTAVSGTSLLTLQNPNIFTDSSGNAFVPTNYGVTPAFAAGPFNNSTTGNKGGMVWFKARSSAEAHAVWDTARTSRYVLRTNSTAAQFDNGTTAAFTFLNGGFIPNAGYDGNISNVSYGSWSFRKAAKFFDVITFTGNGASNRPVAHSLGISPGFIIVKNISTAGYNWLCWHRSFTDPLNQSLYFNLTNSTSGSGGNWGTTSPNAAEFYVSQQANTNGDQFVAYVFAHDTSADGMIQCGSYVGNYPGSTSISLGWEPQFVITKGRDIASDWCMVDTMRGLNYYDSNTITPNTSTAENGTIGNPITVLPNPNGFSASGGATAVNTAGYNYIYIAIRRGPMRPVTSGTTVFSPIASPSSDAAYTQKFTGLSTDVQWINYRSGTSYNTMVIPKLVGPVSTQNQNSTTGYHITSGYEAMAYAASFSRNWTNTGFGIPGNFSGGNVVYYNFVRAPKFMNTIYYTGTGSTRAVTHGLGATPELIILKKVGTNDASVGTNWGVWTTALGSPGNMFINSADGKTTSYMNMSVTSTTFTDSYNFWNTNGAAFVAYVFATLPGVSKVGSYTGTGGTQTINCGFTGGARFVLIKRYDTTGSWWVWDTARGMVSGSDFRSPLNTTAAETNADWVLTTSTGFQIVTSSADVNQAGGSYIYLAIA